MAKKKELQNITTSPDFTEKDSLVQTNIDDFLNEESNLKIENKANLQQNNQENLQKSNDEKQNQENLQQDESVIEEKIEDLVEVIDEDMVEEQESSEDKSLQIQKQKLDEMEQAVSKQKSKKSKILNIVFFIVNLVVVAGILTYQLLKEDLQPLKGINLNFSNLLITLLLLGGVVLTESAVFSYLLKQTTGKYRFATGYKVSQIGKYYDSVTPMATGGQPFQVSYLKSRGVPVHGSLSIPMAKYVFSQIAWVLLSLICLIISYTNKSYGAFVSVTSTLGFVLSSLLLFVTIFLSVCKTVGKKLLVRILKILHKMKIVKNYDKQYEKLTKYISDFQDIMKQYAKSPKDFLILTFLSIAKNVINYSMPFFIAKFFDSGVEGAMYIKLFVMSILVDLSSSFFPLPGGTGMNEISFSKAFEMVMGTTNTLVWVLLLWRFCSYYFYLVQGICILSYDIAYGNRKYKWVVRRDNLAEESMVFKQEQINRFKLDRAKRRKNKNKSSKREYL